MTQREKEDIYHKPYAIYEVHLGSWKKKENDRFAEFTIVNLQMNL